MFLLLKDKKFKSVLKTLRVYLSKDPFESDSIQSVDSKELRGASKIKNFHTQKGIGTRKLY